MKRRFEGQAPRPWAQQASWQMPEGTELTSEAPARPADVLADVVVPVLQSAITGAVIAGVLVFLAWEVVPDLDGNPLKVWAALALGIGAVAWLLLLADTRRLLWAIEKVTGRDLDGDQLAGPPGERVVIVNAAAAQREAVQRADAQRVSQFADFVRRLPTRGTALRAWEGELGRDLYAEYRDALVRLGWAAWNSTNRDGSPNERQGWALTMDPVDILRRIEG